jgi:hypothetical protein
MAFLLAALAVGCNGGRDPILGGGGNAVRPPSITSVTPADNATSVPISNPVITATFSEAMAPITGSATFTVAATASGASVSGTVALDASNRTATFTSGTTLAYFTQYTATVTGARSLSTGLTLASPYVWHFTSEPDTTRPRVSSTVPATTTPGPTLGVTTTTPISATFTEDMAASTVTTAGTFTVKGPGTTAVTGAVTYASKTATFAPAAALLPDTVYTATITTAATDLAGNALAGNQASLPASSNYVWTFRTNPPPDTTRPQVTLTVPATTIPGPTYGAATNMAIAATFTENMAPATITAAGTFTVRGPGGTAVAGAVSYSSQTAVFAPAGGFAADTMYTATITFAATDLAGNQLAGNQAPLIGPSNYVWTFTTGPAPDTTRPRVTLTNPRTTIPGPTPTITTNTAIAASFTEPMAPATITALGTFTLTGPGGTALVGTVSYSSLTAVFVPAAALLANTTYTARITQAATDLAGNQLAGNQVPLAGPSDYIWSFTTSDAPDTIRPRVTLTNPRTTIPGPTENVPTNTTIAASFTKAMAPATITAASFTLTGPGGIAILGGVTYASGTAVFLPLSQLEANTTYTATITKAATDLAGNQLAGNQIPLAGPSDYIWTFTTSLAPDTTRPRVTLTVPATTIPGPTTGIPANTTVTAVFSEDMAATTITVATFLVTGPGGAAVLGDVIYASGTAVFTPASPLTIDTVYTATITKVAADLAGNQLAGNQLPLAGPSDYVWTFRTSAPVPPANISVLSTNPEAGSSIVCSSATISATFNVPSGLRLDPLSINATTFTVTGPGTTPVIASSVLPDLATGHIATFTPASPLTAGVTYTATIKSGINGAKDLAVPANTMLNDFSWSFTVVTCVTPNPSHLGSAAAFGIMATSAITNTGASTMINGDVAMEPGSSCGLLPVQVNGTIHILDSVSHLAYADLLVGYNYYKNLPPGVTITAGADLGALYPASGGGIPPGTYTSGTTMYINTPLVLNAGGNANAVWVFQIGSSLTSTTPLGSVSLLNGANPNNVFWVCTASATIGVGTTFYGTVIAGVSITGQTGAIINGRLLAGAIGAGTIALDSNTVNVPAP